MAYKASDNDLIAYLYGELEGNDKALVEQYLLENTDARAALEKLKQLRSLMGQVEDKEVIAPPLFVGESSRRSVLHTPYLKTILSIAASLVLLMVVGKMSGLQIGYTDRELKISFGKSPEIKNAAISEVPLVSQAEIQQMINASLRENNMAMQASWTETQKKLDASIMKNLALNSSKIDNLVRESSAASQEQIKQFVSGMQAENMKLVKNYFQLNSTEQKEYIEGLLVDFSKYLQQQRNDDLQVVQTQLKSLEQNTNLFKHETEQILTSIISTVGNKNSMGAKN
jgi:hypothetical protein